MRARRQPFLDGAAALRVRRVLYLNGLRGGEIDDAMQEIELRAIEHPPRDSARRRHRGHAWSRRTSRWTSTGGPVGRTAAPEVAEIALPDSTEPAGLKDAMREGLAALAPDLRATVVLRFYADFTVPEIAAAMAIPEGTVKSRLHRAIEELRRCLPLEVLT